MLVIIFGKLSGSIILTMRISLYFGFEKYWQSYQYILFYNVADLLGLKVIHHWKLMRGNRVQVCHK